MNYMYNKKVDKSVFFSKVNENLVSVRNMADSFMHMQPTLLQDPMRKQQNKHLSVRSGEGKIQG